MLPVPWTSLGVQLIVAVLLPMVIVSLPGVARSNLTVPAPVAGVPWKACALARCGAEAAVAIARVAQEIKSLCRFRRYRGIRNSCTFNISMATNGL